MSKRPRVRARATSRSNRILEWQLLLNRAALVYHVKRALHRRGWHVEREITGQGGWRKDRTYWEPEYLRRWDMRPATLIDVGVGYGTPALYDAFPDAYLVLVEPLAEFSSAISTTLARRRGVHLAVAAGAVDETRAVRVEPRHLQGSSFYRRHELEAADDPGERLREVPVRTLDGVIASHELPTPFGLKIDAEGAELDVIRGATQTLTRTDFVIAEVSVLDRFEGSYAFSDFVRAMADAGFAARDILGIGRADTSEVTFIDLMFRRRAPTE